MPVIKNTSVSFDTVLADLTAYVQSKAQYGQAWRDFYAGAAGKTMLELIAGLSTYEQFAIESARRDTFLQECRLRSSAIAIANNTGYSAFRGTNPHLQLTITPNVTLTVAKYTPVGTYKSWALLAANDYTINAGTPQAIEVVIGTLKSEVVTVSSAALQPFRFTASAVSDDARLLLNATVLPESRVFSDMALDKWITITNPQGAVDAFYSNNDTSIPRVYNYATGDALTLEYIAIDSMMGVVDNTLLAVSIGRLDTVAEISEYEPPEPIDSIRVNSPYNADVQHVIRSRSDFAKYFSTTVPNMSSVVWHDDINVPYEHFVSYLRSDFTTLTLAEKATFATELEARRPMGVMPATIVDPISVASTMSVAIYVKSGTVATAGTAGTDVTNTLAAFFNTLGTDFTDGRFMSDMETALESNFNYIQTARITSSLVAALRWYEYTTPAITITLA